LPSGEIVVVSCKHRTQDVCIENKVPE
jgi:hypothetical protein